MRYTNEVIYAHIYHYTVPLLNFRLVLVFWFIGNLRNIQATDFDEYERNDLSSHEKKLRINFGIGLAKHLVPKLWISHVSLLHL